MVFDWRGDNTCRANFVSGNRIPAGACFLSASSSKDDIATYSTQPAAATGHKEEIQILCSCSSANVRTGDTSEMRGNRKLSAHLIPQNLEPQLVYLQRVALQRK